MIERNGAEPPQTAQARTKTLRRLHELCGYLLDRQEQKQRQVARRMHDEIGQSLVALRMLLTGLHRARLLNADGDDPRLEEALAINGSLIENTRQISLDLRPSMLDDLGLPAALLWLAERYQTEDLSISVEHHGMQNRLPAALETAAFRIVEEALSNVARHSGATSASVLLLQAGDELQLVIRDAGCGFDVTLTRRPGSGMGLLTMEERCRLLGGSLRVHASTGAGTVVTARLPLRGR